MSIARKIMMGAAGAAGGATYVDDVFSTYLTRGTGSTKTINNGIDLSGEGGLVWQKCRSIGQENLLIDSERGLTKVIKSNSNSSEFTASNSITSFNANGFTQGSYGDSNQVNQDYSTWTFRKAPKFCDIVTYTGNGQANRVVTHNLDSVPGCIMIKKTSGSAEDWRVYHRGTDPENPGDYYLRLNQNHLRNDTPTFMDTIPTSTQFLLNSYSDVNANGETYVAYIFAGGASTAATARSVDFDDTDGSDDYLSFASNAAFQLGTGDFTVEFWWKANQTTQNNYQQIIGTQSVGGTDSGIWRIGTKTSSNKVYFSSGTGGGFDEPSWNANVNDMQWHHIAITRASGYIYCYVDGVKLVNSGGTNNITRSLTTNNSLFIGHNERDGNYIKGKLSNVRIVKGTAVYTSSFRPTYEPLTNITNTTLLCCNNSSVTGGTVIPVTPTSFGNTSASTDSPFDDPEGFKFGEEEDQNIIKCGSYIGNGSTDGPEINLGWEPQWILTKVVANIDAAKPWCINDVMRGYASVGTSDDYSLFADLNNAEVGFAVGEPTPTGYKLRNSDRNWNYNGATYIYIAIRRPDGYVGKPPEAGTDAFAMDTGNGSATIPAVDSGFPVDFGLLKNPTDGSYNWITNSRLTGTKYLYTNTNAAEANNNNSVFDSNTGYWQDVASSRQGWMWKRGAGFDVVTYKGNGIGGKQIPHSLGIIPEMIWLKYRSPSGYNEDWQVYHKGLNGGSNLGHYSIRLDSSSSQYGPSANDWNNTAPTSTHFTIGSDGRNNRDGSSYITMLFASVPGISSLGSYTGNATDSDHSSGTKTITFGFQPRFVIIKTYDANGEWVVLDTLRGWASGSGNTKRLRLNLTNAQNNEDAGYPTSTGMVLTGSGSGLTNYSGQNYIYYAHA